jgi:hypothetical protein
MEKSKKEASEKTHWEIDAIDDFIPSSLSQREKYLAVIQK